jgi:uncharacterized protein YkwD
MTRNALTLTAALVAALVIAPAAAAVPRLNAAERDLIRRINDVRAHHGLGGLRPGPGLNRAADRHSRDMLRSDFFAHPSSDGTPFHRRVRRYARASSVGETLAYVPSRRGGAGTVIRGWMQSPPHRAILLQPGFTRIGLSRRWGWLGGQKRAVVTADFAS